MRVFRFIGMHWGKRKFMEDASWYPSGQSLCLRICTKRKWIFVINIKTQEWHRNDPCGETSMLSKINKCTNKISDPMPYGNDTEQRGGKNERVHLQISKYQTLSAFQSPWQLGAWTNKDRSFTKRPQPVETPPPNRASPTLKHLKLRNEHQLHALASTFTCQLRGQSWLH